MRAKSFAVIFGLGVVSAFGTTGVDAQTNVQRIALTLAIKEDMVLPRVLNCANRVPGGILVATAKDVKDPVEAKLTYRVKYKTKDGERQTSRVYNVSLFP